MPEIATKKTPMLTRAVQSAGAFCSAEGSRYALTGILIDAGRGVAEATGGKSLIRVPLKMNGEDLAELSGQGAEMESGSLILNPESLDAAFKTLPKKNVIPGCSAVRLTVKETEKPEKASKDWKPDLFPILATYGGANTGVSVSRPQPIEGTFPNTSKVWPEDKETDRVVVLSAVELKKIADFALKHGDRSGAISFRFPEAEGVVASATMSPVTVSPIKFRIPMPEEENHAEGILMPMSVDV